MSPSRSTCRRRSLRSAAGRKSWRWIMSGTVSRGQPGGRGQAGSVSRAGVPLEAPGSGRRCQSRRVAAGLVVAVVAAAVVAWLAGVPPGPWRAPLVARLGAGRRGASRSPPGRSAPRGLAGGSSRDHTTLRDAGADQPAAPGLGITGAVLPPSAGTARRRRRQLRSLTAASAACALLFTPVRNDCDQAQQRPQIPARRRLKLEIEPKMRQELRQRSCAVAGWAEYLARHGALSAVPIARAST